MANYPSNFTNKQTLSSGARGDKFTANIPGYRNQGERINRTYTHTNMSAHDVLNTKYLLDDRLNPLFRYTFTIGFNQIVIPKNRVVALDPHRSKVDFDTSVEHNVFTIANGGAPVRPRLATDVYFGTGGATELVSTENQGKTVQGIGKEYAPIIGFDKAYTTKTYRPFSKSGLPSGDAATAYGPQKQLAIAGLTVDADTGLIVDATTGGATEVIPGNIPIGILERNEYTRDDDAFNGMMVGPVRTDTLVELPWFAYKDKAEGCAWGSAYGDLFPGALVKSDENGRIVISPLSFESEVETMSISEYELERQQIIGQIYSAESTLLPEGSARWATWSLEERMAFEGFNPTVWRETNRKGEDSTATSPYASTGKYPGYGFDKNISDNDLHMLASTARGFSNRMSPEWQYENLGIPGLTDGYNAVVRDYDFEKAGELRAAAPTVEYEKFFLRTSQVDVEKGSLQIQIGAGAPVPVTEGALLSVGGKQFLKVDYVSEHQGIVVLSVTDKTLADAGLATPLDVKLAFKKRGLSGVPTFLDWDGAVGIIKVLFTK